jgi:hypothetical protein
MMAAVIVVALLGGGGGAYLLRKHAPHTSAATAGVAPQIAPAVVPPRGEAAEPAAPPSTGTAEPVGSVMASTFPPSEGPIEVPSGHHHHGKHATADAAKGVPAASGSAVVPAPDFAQDLAPEAPPPAAVSAVKVRLSNIHVANVAATSVTAALPVGSFARCYHGPPASHATATVHLDLTKTTTLAHCSISDSDLADLGACVVNATKRVLVSGVPAGGATADVQVDFDSP